MFSWTLIEHMEAWGISYSLVMKWFKFPRSPLPLINPWKRGGLCLVLLHLSNLHTLVHEPSCNEIACVDSLWTKFTTPLICSWKRGVSCVDNPWEYPVYALFAFCCSKMNRAAVVGKPFSMATRLSLVASRPSLLAGRPLMQNLAMYSLSRAEIFWK